jgi:type II secretory pathway component PulF
MARIVTPRQLRHRSEFYRELAALLAAGVPLLQALEHIRTRPPAADYAAPLGLAQAGIRAGASFTESLQAPGPWLAAFDTALLEAGEKSGRLVESCRLLSDHYAERARLVETLLTQLAYPVFLLHFAVLVFPTSLLVGLVWRGELWPFLAQKAVVLLPLYLAAVWLVLAFQGRRSAGWRSLRERLVHAVPVLGRAQREQSLATLAAALEALINAGVANPEAWELAAAASGSPALIRAVRSWRPRVEAGEPPSEQVRGSGVFPGTFANLYHTGEVSGQLDQELRHLHQYYQESATLRLRTFVRAAALAFYLLIVAVVAFQIISFWAHFYGGILGGPDLE